MSGVNPGKVGNLPGELSSFIGRRRELGEADLLAQGLSNKDIAAKLAISQ